eukprot:TRINITY_DN7075_c0_g1_i3.p1 TRINITY_DN7075_c0_g1~~TRINITY_DN7075_c0_g1_i3.p1  ORF type:complete len:389 (+),score=163.49 TRINITY_DN7075_c0_g1_i3:78-1244(+)
MELLSGRPQERSVGIHYTDKPPEESPKPKRNPRMSLTRSKSSDSVDTLETLHDEDDSDDEAPAMKFASTLRQSAISRSPSQDTNPNSNSRFRRLFSRTRKSKDDRELTNLKAQLNEQLKIAHKSGLNLRTTFIQEDAVQVESQVPKDITMGTESKISGSGSIPTETDHDYKRTTVHFNSPAPVGFRKNRDGIRIGSGLARPQEIEISETSPENSAEISPIEEIEISETREKVSLSLDEGISRLKLDDGLQLENLKESPRSVPKNSRNSVESSGNSVENSDSSFPPNSPNSNSAISPLSSSSSYSTYTSRRGSKRSGFSGTAIQSSDQDGVQGNEIYYVGIIDILIKYVSKKKAEHNLKSIIYDSDGISVVPPQRYAQRFQDFITSIVD